MLIKGEKPTIYELERQGTTVLSDGSSLLQGEDMETTVAMFIAWDEETMQTYLEILHEEEERKHFYANLLMAKQSLRQ
jgi:hypothetical protein